jgi:cell division protein FtsI/penicillin-binding protein 2
MFGSMKQKKTSFEKYIKWTQRLLVPFLLISMVMALCQIYHNYAHQKRYFQIEGIKIDFSQKNNYSIGGYLNRYNNARQFDNTLDSIADIWLPTNLIPSNIGTLQFNERKSEIELILNNLIDDDNKNDRVDEKIIYPKVEKTDEEICKKRESISQKELEKGIKIRYSEGNNQLMALRVTKINSHEYNLLFTPKPNHLLFDIESYRHSGKDSIEFVCGNRILTGENCASTDLIFFKYNFQNRTTLSQTNILTFKDESVFINGEKTTVIPNSRILVKLVEKKGSDIFWIALLINLIAIALFWFVKSHKTDKIVQLLFDQPIMVLLILFNLSAILVSHYLFNFYFDEYFYRYLFTGFAIPVTLAYIRFFNWDSNRNSKLFWGLLTGTVLLALLFCDHLLDIVSCALFFFIPLLTIRIFAKIVNKILIKGDKIILKRWLMIIFPIIFGIGFVLYFFFGSNQRLFGIIPSHTVIRMVIIFSYVIIALCFTAKQGWEILKLVILFVVIALFSRFITKDTGFIILSLLTFLLLFLFNPAIKSKFFKATIFLLFIGNIVYVNYENNNISSLPLIGKLGGDRFELVKESYKDNENIPIGDKQTTDKHRILLNTACKENPWGLWNNFNIPKDMKTVIWSDYVFLYAMVYFGLIPTILILIVLLIFIINLICIASLNYRKGEVMIITKRTKNKPDTVLYTIPFVTITAFVLLSYVSQYLYMIGAMFRVFPLTGQSMPFLSFSWVENLLLMLFLILAFAFFHKSNEVQGDGNAALMDKVKKNKSFPWIAVITVICVTALVGYSIKKKIPLIDFYTETGRQEYQHKTDEKKVQIYNSILAEVTDRYNDFHSFINNVTYNDLLKISGKIDKEKGTRKAKFIKEELSKMKHGRESVLAEIPTKDDNGNIIEWTIKYPEFDEDRQNLAYFASHLKKSKQETKPIPLSKNLVSLYKQNDREFTIYSSKKLDVAVNTIHGLTVTDNPVSDPRFNTLFDENSQLYIRNVNNQRTLFCCNSDLYANFPIGIFDYKDIQEDGLTIDERLQAILYAALNIYCQNNRIKAGGIVVIENKTGKIKGLVSYPSMKANAFEWEKADFVSSNFKNSRSGTIHINKDIPNVALTGYNIASTWKMLQCATALQIDENYRNKSYGGVKMSYHIPHSTNPFSTSLLRDLIKNHKDEFYSVMETEYDISKQGEYIKKNIKNIPDKIKVIPHEQATIGVDLNTTSTNNAIKSTSLGQYNVRIPLIVLTQNMARIITGKKMFPTLFDYNRKVDFQDIDNRGNLSHLKGYLRSSSIYGTAKPLREAKFNGLPVFENDYPLYAKTGTGDNTNHQNLIVFGNENYTYGFFLYNKNNGSHAKYLARDILPYIKLLCPEFINK